MALLGRGAESFKALFSSPSEFLLPLTICHQGPGVKREVWSLLPWLGEILRPLEKKAPGMRTVVGPGHIGGPVHPTRTAAPEGLGPGSGQCTGPLCLKPREPPCIRNG